MLLKGISPAVACGGKFRELEGCKVVMNTLVLLCGGCDSSQSVLWHGMGERLSPEPVEANLAQMSQILLMTHGYKLDCISCAFSACV